LGDRSRTRIIGTRFLVPTLQRGNEGLSVPDLDGLRQGMTVAEVGNDEGDALKSKAEQGCVARQGEP